ncbi:hypothetical protein MKQ70_16875 [Chitinophaga sedimenti]|uniref:hypothetical protein n=1 Tax=Chitinophaga sedimenti TaxID=2033606 RepID=UPI002003594A|nr:hypothetical protein [Chitinophaga sedimenti]MCK7556601.1 hypothetical protein [Chitinophaga sedimenti]
MAEVWQRGPVADVPPLLQPVAHALLQAREEITAMTAGFHDAWLWERPAGVASPAFHLQHLSGVLDRLFTYAREEALSPEQIEYRAGIHRAQRPHHSHANGAFQLAGRPLH